MHQHHIIYKRTLGNMIQSSSFEITYGAVISFQSNIRENTPADVVLPNNISIIRKQLAVVPQSILELHTPSRAKGAIYSVKRIWKDVSSLDLCTKISIRASIRYHDQAPTCGPHKSQRSNIQFQKDMERCAISLLLY